MTPYLKKPGVAFWASVVAVTLVIGYPLSFGVACRLVSSNWLASSVLTTVYRPCVDFSHDGPTAIRAPLNWWVERCGGEIALTVAWVERFPGGHIRGIDAGEVRSYIQIGEDIGEVRWPREQRRAGDKAVPHQDAPLKRRRLLELSDANLIISAMQFAPKNGYLAAVASTKKELPDVRVLLIDILRGAIRFEVEAGCPVLPCFDARAETLVVCSPEVESAFSKRRGMIKGYAIPDGKKTAEFPVTEPGWWQGPRAIGASRTRDVLAIQFAGSSPAVRKAWDLRTGEEAEIEGDDYRWTGSGLTVDGELQSGGGWPGPGVRIRHSDSQELVAFCPSDAWPVTASSFSDDGRLWATVYDDGKLVIWDIRTREDEKSARQLLTLDGFDGCTAVAMSHDLKQLAYATEDGAVWLMPLDLPQ